MGKASGFSKIVLHIAVLVFIFYYAPVFADTPTATPTITVTPCIGEGAALISPTLVYAGSTGNALTITYTAGAAPWAASPGFGTLKFTIPSGWSPPSTNPANAGYITVAVNSGTILRVTISGQDVVINVESLAAITGQIIITYGASSGITIPTDGCPMPEITYFDIFSSPDSAMLCHIGVDPPVFINCILPMDSATPTRTVTMTYGTPTAVPTETSCVHRDASFDSDGLVTWNDAVNNYSDIASAFTLDSSGKIVATGMNYSNDMVAWRYNDDGSLDTTFNGTGYELSTLPGGFCEGRAVTISSAGKIYIAGTANNMIFNPIGALWSFNPDGTPDLVLTGTGYVLYVPPGRSTAYGNAIAIDAAGKIVIAGYGHGVITNNDMFIWRFNPDGSFDTSFAGVGYTGHDNAAGGSPSEDYGYAVAIDPAGKILVAGGSMGPSALQMTVWRYNNDGTLDTTFNSIGFAVLSGPGVPTGSSIAYDIKIDSSGKILVAGTCFSPGFTSVLYRYNSDGTLDTSFNGTGFVTAAGRADSIALSPSGKIYISGNDGPVNAGYMMIWRYNADGTLDTAFNGTGSILFNDAVSRAKDIEIDPLGRIVAAGRVQNATQDAAFWRYIDGCGATPTVTITNTPTATITVTATPDSSATMTTIPTTTPTGACVGEGSAGLDITSFVDGSTGNTMVITFTAGPTSWVNGHLKVIFPLDIGAWSTVPTNPGYFTVSVLNGAVSSTTVLGSALNIYLSSLAANIGQVIITYGDKSLGGPGFSASALLSPCPKLIPILVNSDTDGSGLCAIAAAPALDIVCPPPTLTITQTSTPTGTATATQTGSSTLTPSYTRTFTPSMTGTMTVSATLTKTITATPSYTATFTRTWWLTATPTLTNPVCCWTPTFTSTPAPGAAADLTIEKSATGDQPEIGADVTFKITVRNDTTQAVTDFVVWDTLPEQVIYSSYSASVAPVVTGNVVSFTYPIVASGDIVNIYIMVKIVSFTDGYPIANRGWCDYNDSYYIAPARHPAIYSTTCFYPENAPAVFPNPFNLGSGTLKIQNLVPGSLVRIYTLNAELVHTITSASLTEAWSGKNMYGERVSPGVYYYVITTPDNHRFTGKVFVMGR